MKTFVVTIDDLGGIMIKDAEENTTSENVAELLKQLYNYSRMPFLKESLNSRRVSNKLNPVLAEATLEEEEEIIDAVLANYFYEEENFLKNNREIFFRLAIDDTLSESEFKEENDLGFNDYDD